jgi:acyl-CoA synthetase (AMP-forming)/AMP-acid ligase II
VTIDRLPDSADVQTDPRAAATLALFLPAVAAAHDHRPVVRFGDAELSYRALGEESARRARGLLANGVGKGSRIGLLFGNGPEWVIWWAAIARTGAVCVPLSTFYTPAELARVSRHADLHGIISAASFLRHDLVCAWGVAFPLAGQTRELCLSEAPYLRWIAIAGNGRAPWARDTEDLIASGSDPKWAELLGAVQREVHCDDDALMIYTSGQSAEPKGVFHTHGALLTKTYYLRDTYAFPDKVTCEVRLPFFWVGGLTMGLLPAMAAGGVTICSERSTWGTGQIIGGAQQQDNPFAHLPMSPALGMTETLGIYGWGNDWRVPGFPLCAPIDVLQSGFELKIVGPAGERVTDGHAGEITLRGPTVTRRINKTRREETFDSEGYYRTGDRGVRHGDRVGFIGRIGDMIKTAGANVSPAEVERELLEIPEVMRAHVVGLDDDERDQVVAAAVILAPDVTISAPQIRERLAGRLSHYKIPRKIVVLPSVHDVPMTPSLKVRRPELARVIAEMEEPR